MSKRRQADLSSIVGSAASRVLASAADVSLLLDLSGTILDVTLGDGFEPNSGWKKLVGQSWIDTVTPESRGKVEQLLSQVREGRVTRAREINQKVDGQKVEAQKVESQKSDTGTPIALRFNAVLLEDTQHIIVVGRDLRPIADLQQRLVSTQQAMDRDFGRLRQADTRYRVLFHVALEGVLVVDGATRRVLEANPAAASLLGEAAAAIQGKAIQEIFAPSSWPAVQALLAAVEAGARPADLRVKLQGEMGTDVVLAGLLFRQLGTALVLLRFWSPEASTAPGGARAARMLAMLEALPDAFVVTGEDRRILSANAAFCELVQQANENQVVGEPLDRWLGRPGVDLNIMMSNLREHRSVRNFATIVRGDYGPPQEGLVTAVSALDGKVPCIGFTIRAVSSRLAAVPPSQARSTLPRSIEQLRDLVGRVPLKDLVRESADLVERLCIEAALDVSGNNRASAAQLLGLSRQGLYSKLRRYGLAEFGPE